MIAGDIDVGGKIEAGAVKCGRMRVGGRADIQNMLEAQSVDVGGKVVASGPVKIGDLNVGGEAEVGGGSITGNIHVGGKFIAKAHLNSANCWSTAEAPCQPAAKDTEFQHLASSKSGET